MQHKHYFTSVSHTFTNLLSNDYVFDDISVIFENDFAQILLIKRRDTREIIVNTNI
jgi:hypothetical protein